MDVHVTGTAVSPAAAACAAGRAAVSADTPVDVDADANGAGGCGARPGGGLWGCAWAQARRPERQAAVRGLWCAATAMTKTAT